MPEPELFDVTLWRGRHQATADSYGIILDFRSRTGRARASHELDSLLNALVGEYAPHTDPAQFHLQVTGRHGTQMFRWRLR
jgi:hypothetical protein